MPRCASLLAATVLAAAALLPAAQAQSLARRFPANALRGVIQFTDAPPAIVLDGQAALLAPGARLHATNNLFVTSNALAGQTLTVDYTLEPAGQVFEVWVLTPAEAAVQPWPQTPAQAAAWQFDPDAQTWTRP